MYLHEICYRGECGRKIHLNCFSTYTDKLMTNVPEPIETAAHEAYHMPHYHLPGNNLQFLFEYWKQIINWAFGKLRLGIVVRVANTIKLENISNNDITWLLLSKLFYWSGKLWLLIKMRIQAFRNMNNSYDHYMKQEKSELPTWTFRAKMSFSKWVHDESFISNFDFFKCGTMVYFKFFWLKHRSETFGFKKSIDCIDSNSYSSWFSTCTKLKKLFEFLKFHCRTSILL